MVEETVGRKKLMKKLKAEQKKNADVRARKSAKVGGGTLTERAKKASAKAPEKRGLPARVDQPRGNVNRANPPKEIRLKGEGGTGRAVKDVRFKPVPLGEKPKLLGGPRALAGTGARMGLTRAAQWATGPVGFLVGMTTPAGEGSDKPSGPLMKGGKQPGYRYRDDQIADRAGKGDRVTTSERAVAPSVSREGKTDRAPPKPRPKPERKAERSVEPRKMERKAKPMAQRVTFKGNWVGAAPTSTQARVGQKPKKASLLSFLKNK